MAPLLGLRRINFKDQPVTLPKLDSLTSLKLPRPVRCVLVGRASDQLREVVDPTQLVQKIDSVIVHRLPSGSRWEQTPYQLPLNAVCCAVMRFIIGRRGAREQPYFPPL